ncbi:hypothetical protein ACQEVI_21530 [Promicromonospora sp. CA-289599]|uniref:hypothetical protein n=1 Tax=Promicromonospora sp. CA-289599 TaxID=3240014 RepID=UPI003D94A870
MNRVYREPAPLDRNDLERARLERDLPLLREAMISVALSDPDRSWVERQLVVLAGDPDGSVRSIAALALGHLARVHGAIDRELVLPVLNHLLDDSAALGNAENAIDDIAMFAKEAQDSAKRTGLQEP